MSSAQPKTAKEAGAPLKRGFVALTRFGSFVARVLSHFFANKGLLLAGSVAYNSLLSIIPLCAVILVFLSHFVAEEKVLSIIEFQLDFITTGQTEILLSEVKSLLAKREVLQGIGVFFLLFFSSLAFKTLEDAISVIYYRRFPQHNAFKLVRVFKRDFWISAVIPYVYIASIAFILLLGAFFLSILEAFSGQELSLLGHTMTLEPVWTFGLWVVGFAVQVLMFASIYKVMPVIKIAMRHAFVGGLAAASLWEIVRHLASWYFANVSLVGRVYGSLSTVIVILLMMEVGSLIILLGAQVMAELRWSEAAGLPWHEGAPIPEDDLDDSLAPEEEAEES